MRERAPENSKQNKNKWQKKRISTIFASCFYFLFILSLETLALVYSISANCMSEMEKKQQTYSDENNYYAYCSLGWGENILTEWVSLWFDCINKNMYTSSQWKKRNEWIIDTIHTVLELFFYFSSEENTACETHTHMYIVIYYYVNNALQKKSMNAVSRVDFYLLKSPVHISLFNNDKIIGIKLVCAV